MKASEAKALSENNKDRTSLISQHCLCCVLKDIEEAAAHGKFEILWEPTNKTTQQDLDAIELTLHELRSAGYSTEPGALANTHKIKW